MGGILDVADIRSNAPEQIEHAIKVIGRSEHRLKIFEAIYRGKKRVKKIEELKNALSASQSGNLKVRVLQEGGNLAANQIVKQIKIGVPPQTAYEKIPFYSKNYKKIISLVKNPARAKQLTTKRNPIIRSNASVKIYIDKKVQHKQISIDDIDPFKKIINVRVTPGVAKKWKEKDIKKLFQKILGEKGIFGDWGGEYSDLFSTRVRISGKRTPTAIAFKGRATSGKLTPEKMGKRGTQIERLFQEPAKLFLIVYHGQIDPRILSQMQAFALGKAMSGQKIYYGIIDGNDLDRIIAAYGQGE